MTDYHEIAANLISKSETPHDAVFAAAKQISNMQICIDGLREENEKLLSCSARKLDGPSCSIGDGRAIAAYETNVDGSFIEKHFMRWQAPEGSLRIKVFIWRNMRGVVGGLDGTEGILSQEGFGDD